MSPFLLLLVVQAQVYSWTDKSGVEHFTDDLKTVPRGVKVRTTEGTEISRIESDVKKPAPTTQLAAAPSEPAAPSIAEETWRRLFREARAKITNLEDDIEADRKKVEEVNGLPVTARFNCQTGFSTYPYPVIGQQFVVNGGALNVGGQLAPGFVVNGSVGSTTVTTTGAPIITQTPMYYAPCGFNTNPEFDRVRDRLERNRREIVRAREELADLDRRASYESVPQEWRR